MKRIDAAQFAYKELNEEIRQTEGDCTILNCVGQRFIGAGMDGKTISIKGTPGNALGAAIILPKKRLGDGPTQAGGQGDQSLVVVFQQLHIHTGLAVEAMEKCL